MKTEELLDEIYDLNLAYLMLAQRMIKKDPVMAQFRLKLDASMARVLTSLTTRQLGQLARTNQFLFRMCLDDAEQLDALVNKKRESGLVPTHASLLMAEAA